jgi:crotonobetainyl-CoA:carnitine CoA-transferase CaiB-like acyl-CoA transferase
MLDDIHMLEISAPETMMAGVGEHSSEILRELCRMNDREIAELKEAGVLVYGGRFCG